MQKVQLRNGQEEPVDVVNEISRSIKELWNSGVAGIALVYDLREICEGHGERVSNDTFENLKNQKKFIQDDGMINSSVRNIVLSSIKGTGLDLELIPAVTEEQAALVNEKITESNLNILQKSNVIQEFLEKVKSEADAVGRSGYFGPGCCDKYGNGFPSYIFKGTISEDRGTVIVEEPEELKKIHPEIHPRQTIMTDDDKPRKLSTLEVIKFVGEADKQGIPSVYHQIDPAYYGGPKKLELPEGFWQTRKVGRLQRYGLGLSKLFR
jgi:hypothetical protein